MQQVESEWAKMGGGYGVVILVWNAGLCCYERIARRMVAVVVVCSCCCCLFEHHQSMRWISISFEIDEFWRTEIERELRDLGWKLAFKDEQEPIRASIKVIQGIRFNNDLYRSIIMIIVGVVD